MSPATGLGPSIKNDANGTNGGRSEWKEWASHIGCASMVLAHRCCGRFGACGRSARDPAEELNAETGRYQRIREALDHPAMKVGANRDALQRLSDQLARHEESIKALHAEIRRTHRANDR